MKLSQEVINICRDYISNGETDKAIHILIDHVGKTDKNLILLSSRWSTLQKNKVAGVIETDNYFTNKSIIDDSILTILDIIESEEEQHSYHSTNDLRRSNNAWLKPAGITLIFLIFMSIIWFSVPQTPQKVPSTSINPVPQKEETVTNANADNDNNEFSGEPLVKNQIPRNMRKNGFLIHADSYFDAQLAIQKQNQIFKTTGLKSDTMSIKKNGEIMYRLTLYHTAGSAAEAEMIKEGLIKAGVANDPWMQKF